MKFAAVAAASRIVTPGDYSSVYRGKLERISVQACLPCVLSSPFHGRGLPRSTVATNIRTNRWRNLPVRASRISLEDPYLIAKLDSAENTYKELSVRLGDPDVAGNPSEYQALSKSLSELEEVVETYRKFKSCEEQLLEAKELAQDAAGDKDMAEMAPEEIKSLEKQIAELESQLKVLHLPSDPLDSRNIMLEAKAGTGGDEAGIWAGDLEWEKRMLRENKDRDHQRQKDEEEEQLKEAEYRAIGQQLQGYPAEEVRHAKKLVSNLIRAGSVVEEMIVDAADNNELTPLVLLVIKNRLELARHDDERDAVQALDLLYRRIESEMLSREAPVALHFLNELLNLHDGFSREEWLQRSRQAMLQMFPPEDAFTFLGSPGFDLYNHHGPIEMPEEEEEALLRIDFIREVDNLVQELESAPEMKPVTGFDPGSIALRLRQEEKKRAIQQVKELRHLAATLKW